MRRRRQILVAISDTHGWHSFGLLNPDTELYDEDPETGTLVPYTPELTATQKWLWRCYKEDIASVSSLAGKDPIKLVHIGDVGQGDKWGGALVSGRRADQLEIVVANLAPWFELRNMKALRITQGTAAHNFGLATVEIAATKQLKAMYPKVDIKTWRHGLIEVVGSGIMVDVAHHGPYPGSREWLKGNVARYYLRDLMMGEFRAGQEPPDLVLRGHYHRLVQEVLIMEDEGKEYTSRLAVLPAYCGLTEYAQKATRSISRLRCGLIAYEIIGDAIFKAHPFTRSIDLRTKDKL